MVLGAAARASELVSLSLPLLTPYVQGHSLEAPARPPSQPVQQPVLAACNSAAVSLPCCQANRGALRWAFDRWAAKAAGGSDGLLTRDLTFQQQHRSLPQRPAASVAQVSHASCWYQLTMFPMQPAAAKPATPMMPKRSQKFVSTPMELAEFSTPPQAAFQHISAAAAETNKQMSELQSMLQGQGRHQQENKHPKFDF